MEQKGSHLHGELELEDFLEALLLRTYLMIWRSSAAAPRLRRWSTEHLMEIDVCLRKVLLRKLSLYRKCEKMQRVYILNSKF